MYIVIEIQSNQDGTLSVAPVQSYVDRLTAEARYHEILSFAAVSKIWKRSAVMLTDEGTFVKGECYEHGDTTPEASE